VADDLKRLWDKATNKAWERGWIRGRLGRLDSGGTYTIRVSGKAGWVHVRQGIDGDGGLTQARNLGVAEVANLPVRMRREGGELVVYGSDPSPAPAAARATWGRIPTRAGAGWSTRLRWSGWRPGA
jgi:hypothetical protein